MSGAPADPVTVALDVDIGSREGVSRDHAARIRVQFLMDQTALFSQQTQFADTKATAVLAFAGVIGGRAAAGFDFANLGAVEVVLLALTGAALALCLLVLLPRYPSAAEREALMAVERYSWVTLSAPGHTGEHYARFVRSAEISQIIASAAAVNVAMARILAMKFRFLRAAFIMAIAAVAVATAILLGLTDTGLADGAAVKSGA